jgi:predicted lipoprotein
MNRKFYFSTFFLLLLFACRIAEVRTFQEDREVKEGFTGARFVQVKWDSEIIPQYHDHAYDLVPLLDEFANNPDLIKEYGYQGSQGQQYSLMVKSEAKIITFDNSLSNGTIQVDLPPYDGTWDVTLVIGPKIKVSLGFPLRDAGGFITFNQFVNQLEYGDVAGAMRERVAREMAKAFGVGKPEDIKTVLNPADFEGKTIYFYGAMGLEVKPLPPEARQTIIIIPVELKVLNDGSSSAE